MFIQAASALEAHDNLESLWQAMRTELAKAGFDFAIYITLDDQWQSPFVLTNVPEIYALMDPSTDPFLSHCCASYAITTTGVDYLPDYEYLPDSAKAFIQQASDTGWRTGLGIPMRLQGSPRFGGFNLGTRADRTAFERDILPKAEDLRLLCLIAHRRIEELLKDKGTPAPDTFRELLIAPAAPHMDDLTPREREIAYLVAQGFSRKECARMCGISPNTVADYLKSCYRKLGVNDRVALARLFTDAGAGM